MVLPRWPQTMPACLAWLAVTLTLALALTSQTAAGQAPEGIIFPEEIGYSNYRAKRLFTDASSDCHNCLNTYDYDSCQRCWNAKPSFIPFHAKRSSGSSYAFEPLVRYQRGSGCGCCYLSRFTNQHCCQACMLTSKRTGKRSGDLMSSDLVEKRANPDCLCCLRYNDAGCCSTCAEWK